MSALREGTAAVGTPERRIISWRRLLVSLAAGAAAAVTMAAAGMAQLAVLVGWAIAASAVLAWVGGSAGRRITGAPSASRRTRDVLASPTQPS